MGGHLDAVLWLALSEAMPVALINVDMRQLTARVEGHVHVLRKGLSSLKALVCYKPPV